MTAVRTDPTERDTTPTKSDIRRLKAHARAEDEAISHAYDAGVAGEKMLHLPGDAPEVRDAHRKGLDERARSRRARIAKGAARKTAGAVRAVKSHADDVPTGGSSGTWIGVGVGVLALVGLYLALSRTNAISAAVSGLSKALAWIVSPSPLPF